MLRPFPLIIIAVLIAGLALVFSVGFGRSGRSSVDNLPGASEPVIIGRSYRVDAGYVKRTGAVPPLAFQIILPKRPEETHKISVEEAPAGGVVQFNFHGADDSFWESLFIAPIRIPMGDMDERLAGIAPQLAEQGPALLRQKFEDVTAEPVREVRIGELHGEGYRAVELTGRYLDPRDGARYSYRFIAVPDPERAQSLYAVSHINAAYREIAQRDEFAGTLAGMALSTLQLDVPLTANTTSNDAASSTSE